MKKSVVVIGGGISGLLSSYYAVKRGFKVTVYEKNRWGGKLQTEVHPLGLMESAANGILVDLRVEKLCADIGLELISTEKSARARWIYRNGKARRWPLSFAASTKILSFFMFKNRWVDDIRPQETLQSWGHRYLGKEITEYILDPVCQGIFATVSENLSAKLVLHYFFKRQKPARGRLRGTISFRNGMHELIETLKKYLSDQNVIFIDQNITDLKKLRSEFDEVIVATDPPSAALLLDSIGDSRAHLLEKIPMVDVVSVNMFFAKSEVPYPGFGILFPRPEKIGARGVVQNQFIFAHRAHDALSETWIYGGPVSPFVTLSDEEIEQTVLSDRKKVFNRGDKLLVKKINRWPKALPLYGKELEVILDDLKINDKHVHLMGNYLGQIGLNRLFERSERLVLSI